MNCNKEKGFRDKPSHYIKRAMVIILINSVRTEKCKCCVVCFACEKQSGSEIEI